MNFQTNNLRAELNNGYCYVRNLEAKGGVIDALVSPRAEKKIKTILEAAEGKTFSQVWDELITVKGSRFEYRSN